MGRAKKFIIITCGIMKTDCTFTLILWEKCNYNIITCQHTGVFHWISKIVTYVSQQKVATNTT